MDLTLEQATVWCGGRIEPPEAASNRFSGVSTDSRTIRKGELFIAISGEHFDGHRYVHFAQRQGAVGAVVERDPGDCPGLPLIVVENTLAALGKIANGWRWHPPLIPWIAITGSNGKTTTRELLSIILATRWKTRVSQRNWNNFVGLPLSMMGKPDNADVAVMELGTNHPGEIAALREICVPTVAVVTSTGESHLEGFGSSTGVAHEKSEIFKWLPPDGLAVYPADDPHADILRAASPHNSASFSVNGAQADLIAKEITVRSDGTTFSVDGTHVFLPLLGRHNIGNCLAAMLAARHLGIDIHDSANAVAAAKPVQGRLQATDTPAGITVINDAYNANPNSVRAALRVLADLPGQRKIAVLGDMMELGESSSRLHREIGETAGSLDIDALLLTGNATTAMAESAQRNAHIFVRHYQSAEALWLSLHKFLRPGDKVLVKGSRAMKLEYIVTRLLEWFPQ